MKKTIKACLIGYPVGHSKSPLIHTTIGKIKGDDVSYDLVETPPESLGETIERLFDEGYDGFNVTVPHKCEIFKYLNEVSDKARVIGAVNTCLRDEHGYSGYNTDAGGFERSFVEIGIELAGHDCVVYGAGGVARAVIYTLIKLGAGNIYVINRTTEKTLELKKDIDGFFETDKIKVSTEEEIMALGTPFYCFQCTSVGLGEGNTDCIIKNPHFLDNCFFGYDTVPVPEETGFMKMCKSTNTPTIGGVDMLIYQAVIAYEFYASHSVSYEDISKMRKETGL